MKTTFIAAIMAAAATGSASAQNLTANPDAIAAVMQDAGYRATPGTDDVGDPKISSAAGGVNFDVLFYGCDGKNCKTVQFVAGWSTDDIFSLQAANDWNKENRFGSVYVDEEGDPIIKMDVNLEDGGMSAALFQDNLEYWESVVGGFYRDMVAR
ncbi:YbjN domain-containing protein [Pacificimonas sp. WHA3]|uniref:YbjN domain-containing protein n=1 Tax=Pacificimonas pallii TaxID=2827236 RepID=A0ABS6SFN8_9SPHN|nr:YbjN domain-containing protein [Pacificimonas pallii]MBV7256667.1 YbjN domain-containing protein [Pacificimonas pallii]